MSVSTYARFCVLCALCILIPQYAYGESALWNTTLNGGMGIGDSNWSLGFNNPNITIQYRAFVKDATTGATIPPNATVPVGTKVTFVFDQHLSSDIYWFATGQWFDSPYGDWGNPNTPPPVQCLDKDYIGEDLNMTEFILYAKDYAAFVVAPPTQTIQGIDSTMLSCGAFDGYTMTCTTLKSGPVTATFTFSNTYGSFYGRVLQSIAGGPFNCTGNQSPMVFKEGKPYTHNFEAAATFFGSGGTSKTRIDVPIQTIVYPFSVGESEPGNRPPTAATLSAIGSGQCTVGMPYTIQMQATDPDNDSIRYGVDWDNNGTIDQFVPASGYVSSGSVMTATRTYSVPGSKTISVIVQDEKGLSSPSKTFTFDCTEQVSTPPVVVDDEANVSGFGGTGPDTNGTNGNANNAQADIRAVPSLVKNSGTSQVTWSAQGVNSCTVRGTNGDSWDGTSGSRPSSLITERVIYTLTCQTDTGTITDSATVNILPKTEEI